MKHLVDEREHAQEESETTAVAETDPDRRRLEQCWFEAYHGLMCWTWEIGRKCERGGKVYECKWWWYSRWEEGKKWNSWYRRLDDGSSQDASVEECLSECFGSSEGKTTKDCHDLSVESSEVEAMAAPVRRLPAVAEADSGSSLPAVAEADSDPRRRIDQCHFEAYHGLWCWGWEIGNKCERGGKAYECKWWWYNRWEEGKKWDSWYRRLDDGTDEHSDVPPEGAIGHKPTDEEIAALKDLRLKSETDYFEHLGRAPTDEEVKHLVEEREHAEESDTTVAETDQDRRRLEQCWFEAYHGLMCWTWEIGRKCERGGKVYECKWWWYSRWEEGKKWNSWYRRLDDGSSQDASVEECLSECFGSSEGKTTKDCHDLSVESSEVEAMAAPVRRLPAVAEADSGSSLPAVAEAD